MENGTYHFICAPTQEEKTGIEQLHILCGADSSCELELVCLFRPGMRQDNNLPQIREYVNWWNSFNDYLLDFDEEKNLLQAHTKLFAATWEDLGIRLNDFIRCWKADKVNTLTLILGVLDLSVCQGAKLKAINPDE